MYKESRTTRHISPVLTVSCPLSLNQIQIQCNGYSVFFFLGTRLGRTRGRIFTVNGSYDVFSPKDELDSPFGIPTISEFTWGNSPHKLPQKSVNRQFQAKLAEYKNHNILQSINMIKATDGRHFENPKYAITRPRIVRSSLNFAQRCRYRRKFDFFLTNIAKI